MMGLVSLLFCSHECSLRLLALIVGLVSLVAVLIVGHVQLCVCRVVGHVPFFVCQLIRSVPSLVMLVCCALYAPRVMYIAGSPERALVMLTGTM